MALIPCPECDRQVSTAAASCPSCGYPLAASMQPLSGKPPAWADAGLLAKITGVVGAWLIVPWAARVLAFIAACVVAIVLFTSGGK